MHVYWYVWCDDTITLGSDGLIRKYPFAMGFILSSAKSFTGSWHLRNAEAWQNSLTKAEWSVAESAIYLAI